MDALPEHPPAPGHPARRGLILGMFGAGLLLNVLVCVPFVFDPLDWRGVLQARTTSGATDWVVMLARNHDPRAVTRFFSAHPDGLIIHRGGTTRTLLIRVRKNAAAYREQLAAAPFAAFVTPGDLVLCR